MISAPRLTILLKNDIIMINKYYRRIVDGKHDSTNLTRNTNDIFFMQDRKV